MRRLGWIVCVVVGSFAMGCGPDGGSTSGPDSTTEPPPADQPVDETPDPRREDTPSPTRPGGGDDPGACKAGGAHIYFTTTAGRVYDHDVDAGTLTILGELDCTDSHPYAMARDSDDKLWVYFGDKTLHKVDPADLSCEATAYVEPPSDENRHLLSLTFVDTANGEELYATYREGSFPDGPASFRRIDTQTFAVTAIGPIATSEQTLAIHGRRDGTLQGMYRDDETRLYELDAATGGIVSEQVLPSVLPLSWPTGFAAWGGELWFAGYYNHDFGLFHYDTATDTIAPVMNDVMATLGLEFVGLANGIGTPRCSRRSPPRGTEVP